MKKTDLFVILLLLFLISYFYLKYQDFKENCHVFEVTGMSPMFTLMSSGKKELEVNLIDFPPQPSIICSEDAEWSMNLLKIKEEKKNAMNFLQYLLFDTYKIPLVYNETSVLC